MNFNKSTFFVLTIAIASGIYFFYKPKYSIQNIYVKNNSTKAIAGLKSDICGKTYNFPTILPEESSTMKVELDCEQALTFQVDEMKYIHKPVGGRYLSPAFHMDMSVSIREKNIVIDTVNVEHN